MRFSNWLNKFRKRISNGPAKGAKRRRGRAGFRASLCAEHLEHRQLMSATSFLIASLQNGELKITGTSEDDILDISQDVNGNIQIAGSDIRNTDGGWLTTAEEVQHILIDALGGNDTIRNNTNIPMVANGGDGNDNITGGTGQDTIYGGLGDDTLDGGAGNDAIYGDAGNDTLYGGAGNDYLNDSYYAWQSHGDTNHLYGGDDNDTFELGDSAGVNHLDGGKGNDTFYAQGSVGLNFIDGGADQDTIHGGWGDDTINGGGGDDTIYGNYGRDTIHGGDGN
ncbi:MAG: hypothetical protein KDA78_19095, partial [Planctomycetaceae bacterium]|nr:hypothetical protein [Planctomycetaceae bacterium]